MISVIVTVYNVEPYIRRCIESIVNQSYTSLQIILIDDGSTDGSGAICDEFARKDSRIEVIHQNNQGVMKALYAGIQRCNQEYVTCVDGDDWLHKDTYMELSSYLKKSIDLVTFGAVRFFSDDYQRETHDRYPQGIYDKNRIEKYVISNMLWDHQSNKPYNLDASLCLKLFKRQLFKESIERAKDLDIYYGQDAAILYPLMVTVQNVRIVHTSYYYHRQRVNPKQSPYYQDPKYYAKILTLCDYLNSKIGHIGNLSEQIDAYFHYSIQLKNSNAEKVQRYVFPFNLVPCNSKLVLYGAGRVGKEYFYQINKIQYGELVLWVDQKQQEYQGYAISKMENILQCEYDYIIIAIESESIAQKVKENLLNMGVRENQIVWSGK